jgi:hypothetical protein
MNFDGWQCVAQGHAGVSEMKWQRYDSQKAYLLYFGEA